jgi:hypothetical protein
LADVPVGRFTPTDTPTELSWGQFSPAFTWTTYVAFAFA